ncbi:esterase-like activity of phytase family protein [Corynebacterium sp. A21]|uniref:esterase-like activity of phytase family protein n=1 Tax=Corynebacterium sp. A21 TaxID=3457318 RepID=UPI003FD1632E
MNLNRRIGTALILTATALPLAAGPAAALSSELLHSSSSLQFPGSSTDAAPVTEYLGYLDLSEATWETDLDERLAAAPLGGLSGIEHVAGSHYIAISDDPAQRGPARAYHLDITFDEQGAVSAATITDIIELTDAQGQPFAELAVDPESLRVLPDGNLLWTTEGFAREGDFRAPQVVISDPTGRAIDELAVPAHHTPDAELTTGIRHNNANEGLTLSADGLTAITLNEGALQQDGPANTEEEGATVRLTTFDLATGNPTAEYAVEVGPKYPGATDRGMAEILAVGDGSFIVLERGFIPEEGNRAELYRITLDGATDILDTPALTGEETPATKELLFSFDDNAEHPENVEGLAWGPQLEDGRRSLLVISDDNFNATQRTLLHTVAVDLR